MTRTRDIRSVRTYIIAQIALIGFAVFSIVDYARLGIHQLVIAISAILVTFVFILFLHRIDSIISEAFSIPLILYLIHTSLSFITGQYTDYFVLCLGISCLGALFFNSRQLLKYILVSNSFTVAQIFLGVIESRSIANVSIQDNLFNWFISLMGSCFIYIVCVFAEDKNNDAKKAQDSFVSLLTSTPDPIVLLDTLNRVIYISNSFMKMIHLEKSLHAKNRSVFDLIKDPYLRNLFYDILTRGESGQTTHELVLDGQQRFFEIVVFPLVNEVKGTLVNIVDITPVMKAKFEAEAASRSKSAFLATMSHEIRTPLNAIIGLSEIELQKNLPVDTRMDMEKIHHSGASLLAIINDILDISKIESGSFELVPVDYDVPSMVNDTVQLNIVRIGSKKISFKLKIDETIPFRLFGDELRIRQVLTNILSNAFKYTHEGSVMFTVTWKKIVNTAWINFKIKDTGQGIKNDDIPKLFSEYRQLDAQANRHIEGTGLGLSITKNLISLMKGTISVESEYGQGTLFTVEIPQRIIDETPIGKNTAQNLELFRYKEIHRSQALRLVRSHMPYGKVLVVDDVETNLDVARGLMLPYGLTIDTALSGQEAIGKIRAITENENMPRYDLILMDHMMPGMDGIEAVRIIRNELSGEYGRTVPIVALTANALAGNEDMFLANGFNAFISKPIDIIQLDTVLNAWVRNKQNTETIKQAEMEMIRLEKNDGNTPGILDNEFVEGLDLIRGRQRYIKESAYIDILRSWHLHTPILLNKLRNVNTANLQKYAVSVHGLKGSSFGICADEIGKKADELESLAKNGDITAVQEQSSAFINKVEAMLNEVGELLNRIAASAGTREKKTSIDIKLLDKMLEAVKRYKSALMEESMKEIELYDYEQDNELVTWLRLQMDNLEYDAIRNRLEAVRKEAVKYSIKER